MRAYSWECMQVQGMLPSPPRPPTPTQRYVCVCVQLGMYASPRSVTIPTPPTHPDPNVCVCVCVQLGMYASATYVNIPHPTHPPTHLFGNVCKSKVCYHPHPTHPPQPKGMCVCTVGNVCKSKVCYHPHPTHPPTPKVVYVCVQMSPQKHVVCTDESDLCAQMRLLGCVYR